MSSKDMAEKEEGEKEIEITKKWDKKWWNIVLLEPEILAIAPKPLKCCAMQRCRKVTTHPRGHS